MKNKIKHLKLLCQTALAILFLPSLSFAEGDSSVELTGAGSTFVYPVISKWADAYKNETGVRVNYQSIGSGGGIKQIQNKTVDFGATDMPLTPENLAKDGLVQFPIVSGGSVPVIHLSAGSPGQLNLTGKILAEIFMGKIKKWNDIQIAKLNPKKSLPDSDITVIHRSDGAGTTFIWTNYLSKVSPEWKKTIGEGSSVNWPVGVGGKGNEGVASYVQRIEGSIGYVEYAFALQNKLEVARIQNRSGAFIAPGTDSFRAAASEAQWEKSNNFYLVLTDGAGKKSWPITGSTFVLMRKFQENPERGREVLKFFQWVFHHGEKLALDLDYVPLPSKVSGLIEKKWRTQFTDSAGVMNTHAN